MENLQQLIDDNQKWNMAEWQMRLEWVFRLQKHCDRIKSGKASDEDFDLFWIKFWGFLEEFTPPFEELKKLYENLNDPNSEYYKSLKPDVRDHLYQTFSSMKPLNFNTIVLSLSAIVSRVEDIKSRYTRDELFWAYDYRTHICHPTSSFYRLRMKKLGNFSKNAVD